MVGIDYGRNTCRNLIQRSRPTRPRTRGNTLLNCRRNRGGISRNWLEFRMNWSAFESNWRYARNQTQATRLEAGDAEQPELRPVVGATKKARPQRLETGLKEIADRRFRPCMSDLSRVDERGAA